MPPDAVRSLKDSPVKEEVAQDTMEAPDSSLLRLRYPHPEPEEDTIDTNERRAEETQEEAEPRNGKHRDIIARLRRVCEDLRQGKFESWHQLV